MNVVFLTPHTKISGGVKVIFKIAQGLKAKGVQVCVVAKKHNDKTLSWFGTPNFKIIEDANPTYHTLPECDVLINYGDVDPFIPLLPGIKQVLLMQSFGVHDNSTEKNNLLYPYAGIITVSSWLATIAKNCKQSKIYIIAPGVDDNFHPIDIKSKIPIIGTLYHSMAIKNVAMYEDTILHLFHDRHINVKPLLLSARPVPMIDTFSKGNIPYSLIINPPQTIMPFIYSGCSVWMSPAYREGFGLTTLEAMACGVPVIAVKNFGLDDYLKHSENCLFVKNKKEAAEAIIELVNSPELRVHLINNGIELAGRFTWEKTVNQFYYALQDIIKQ